MAGLDQFLFWPLSVLVLARLDRFLPWSVRLYHFLSCPESISSCLGQTLSVNILFIFSDLVQLIFLVLARLDQFLSWLNLITSCHVYVLYWPNFIISCLGQTQSLLVLCMSCLGQTRSLLVLDRIDQLLSWTESISSCLGQNHSVIFLDRLDHVLSLPHSVSSWPNSVNSCLRQIQSVLGKFVLVFARLDQFGANQFLSLCDSISSWQINYCLCQI